MYNNRGFNEELQYMWRNGGVLTRIILLNVIVFAVDKILLVTSRLLGVPSAYDTLLGLLVLPADPNILITRPWTLVSYFFLHGGLWHILFNMLFLYWFGRIFMEFLGKKRLFALYFLGGVAAAVFFVLIYNIVPYYEGISHRTILLGASGAVFAIVVGAAVQVPNYMIYVLLIGPVRIKYIALVYVFLSFIGITGVNSGGELAHLGGALMGYIYIIQLRRGIDIGKIVYITSDWLIDIFTNTSSKKQSSTRHVKPKRSTREDVSQEEIDHILDKISQSGYESLSRKEKEKLFRVSKKK